MADSESARGHENQDPFDIEASFGHKLSLSKKRRRLQECSSGDVENKSKDRSPRAKRLRHEDGQSRPLQTLSTETLINASEKVSRTEVAMASYHHHQLHHHHHHLSNGVNGGGGGSGNGGKLMDSMSSGNSSSNSSKFSSSGSSAMSGSSCNKSPSIASLCNLGNTCFLNSVLYTLRFTPGFLHNLHHLVQDLTQHNNQLLQQQQNGQKSKGSRSSGMSNGHGLSNGHHLALDSPDNAREMEMVNDVIEKMHDLFKNLSCADETSDTKDPIQPSSFLNAVGKLNPLFEGNQQQDAHELLITIFHLLEDIKIPASTIVSPDNQTADRSGDLPPQVPEKKGKKKKLLQNGGTSSNGLTSSSHMNGCVNGISKDPRNTPSPAPSPSPTAQPPSPSLLPNFVRENFEGKAVYRTRCLECEASTYRSETFKEIQVPLQLEDEEEELSGRGELFLKQIMMSETLRESNKYWCEECSRLNEARRSVQFELLPKVMVLHLKRFTTAGPRSTYISVKINDYIPTPFVMNCFCQECLPPTTTAEQQRSQQQQPKTETKHRYRLFAVIMHLGASLASGHYIAYVRVSPDFLWDYSNCQRGGTVERNRNKKGIMKFLRRGNGESKSSNGDLSSSGGGGGGGSLDANGQPQPSCRSARCCGIKGPLLSNAADHHHGGNGGLYHQRSMDSTDSSDVNSSSSLQALDTVDDLWLECDDESIQVITRRQFEEILSAKQGATTPYLLFYQKF